MKRNTFYHDFPCQVLWKSVDFCYNSDMSTTPKHITPSKAPALTLDERLAVQRKFLDQLGTQQPFRQLFEHLPGIHFFVKDVQCRMICASQSIVEQFGFQHESELIGSTDYDFFPPQIADNFVRDDRWVMETGQTLTGRVEMWYQKSGILDWITTNKLPLRNVDGEIVGVMGTLQSYDSKQKSLLPFFEITRVVDYIREHYQEPITVEQLAALIYLSPRQLRRKFHDVFGMSPQDFLIKTRIQAASEVLIHGEVSISEIAQRFGFCDQSAFTQQFRKQMGLTPLQYRRKYTRRSDTPRKPLVGIDFSR